MPTYTYQCGECELIFEKFHLMSETVEKCEKCGSSVKRILSKSFNTKKDNNFGQKKPGTVVHQYIKDVKKELKDEKQKLSTQEYKTK